MRCYFLGGGVRLERCLIWKSWRWSVGREGDGVSFYVASRWMWMVGLLVLLTRWLYCRKSIWWFGRWRSLICMLNTIWQNFMDLRHRETITFIIDEQSRHLTSESLNSWDEFRLMEYSHRALERLYQTSKTHETRKFGCENVGHNPFACASWMPLTGSKKRYWTELLRYCGSTGDNVLQRWHLSKWIWKQLTQNAEHQFARFSDTVSISIPVQSPLFAYHKYRFC